MITSTAFTRRARLALAAASALTAVPATAQETAPAPAAPGAASLDDQFRDPPNSARPRVWWHWMNGNVTKDGIAKDMAWMKRVGIGGMQNFDANLQTPQIVDKRLVYMTPEWKEAMRQNRIKINLRNQLKGVPTLPWMWRLQHEYDTAIKPIRELGWSFRRDILALLTPQQRQAALADISARAGQQGLDVEDKDQAVLGIAGSSTWSLWKF